MGNAICTKCEHYRHIIKNTQNPEAWYNHFCGAVNLEPVQNPVTGKRGYGYKTENPTGEIYVSGDAHPFCRDINKSGNCEMFELKPWVSENAN